MKVGKNPLELLGSKVRHNVCVSKKIISSLEVTLYTKRKINHPCNIFYHYAILPVQQRKNQELGTQRQALKVASPDAQVGEQGSGQNQGTSSRSITLTACYSEVTHTHIHHHHHHHNVLLGRIFINCCFLAFLTQYWLFFSLFLISVVAELFNLNIYFHPN